MPARLNPKQDQRSRTAIQTTQLCKRLNAFALGENDPQTDKPLEMTDGQIRAALGILKKTLPDLQATTLDGQLGINAVGELLTAIAERPGHRITPKPIAKPNGSGRAADY